MINFPLNLSKLSRGKGERKGSYIQVIYDDRDLNERNYGEFIRNHLHDESRHTNQLETLNEQRKLNLPKTFTTRRGPLLLFSEDSRVQQTDFFSDHERNAHAKQMETNELKSFKTIRNLRKSILEFGGSKEPIEYTNRQNTRNDSFIMERENTLETFSLFKEIKTSDDPQFEKIRPGFSAKRYLSNWTRHWRPELFDNFVKEGRIKEETLFEQAEAIPNSKQRIDDDISRVPPVYRINRKWLTMPVAPLKGYRFYRVKTDLMGLYDETTESLVGGPPPHPTTENIQVVDKDGNNIDYINLSKSDKEIVLTELLLQTALQSIAEKRIESIEETFKKNIYLNNSQLDSSLLIPPDLNFGNKLSVKDMNPNELISTSTYVNKTMQSNTNLQQQFIPPVTSNYLFPRMSGNKLSPIKPALSSTPTNKLANESTASIYEKKKLRKRSFSQTTPRVQEKFDIESQFMSNSLQNFQTSNTILEEKEEDIKILDETLDQTIVSESLNETNLSNSIENLPQTNDQQHQQINLVLPEIRELDSVINLQNKAIVVEPTLIEIDPKILEQERHEEEMLKKELQEEEEKKEKVKENVKSKFDSEEAAAALEEMLSKKHYQSTVSISNISIGDDFDPNNLDKQTIRKKSERFILNRHNYHHPRKPKNKVLELYRDAKLAPSIQLGDNAILNVIPEREPNLINKLVKNRSPGTKETKKTKGDSASNKKVVVLGPDGIVTQIGTKLQESLEKSDKKKKKDHEVFYRLFDEIPPYLYYTNKIDTSNTYVKYERENSEKLIAEQNMAKKAAEEILETEKKLADEEPILNKQILQALTNHAQQMAKIALESHGSGMDLVKDIKMALNENYKKLKAAYRVGEIDVKEFEEYTQLMKDALKTSLSELFSQSIDFSNVIIDDGLLGSLLEYPTSAFEIVTDPETKRKVIQIKKSYKPIHTNLANEMNLDLEQIENEVRNKANQRPFGKDAKLETNVNTSKNTNASDAKPTDNFEVAKKLDDDEDDDEAKEVKSMFPNQSALPQPTNDKPEGEETKEDEEIQKEKEKKKKKPKKPKDNKEGEAAAEEDKKNKKKGVKNKKDKKGDKGSENKDQADNQNKEEENLDPKELKRRQQAEERRLQAERRRLEKEEEKRREEEEQLRREAEARAAEEEKKRQEEELEKKREAEREKQRRIQAAQEEKERKKREEEEKRRLAEEEKERRMEEMKIKFIEELTLKAKQEEEEKLEEERRQQERERLEYEAAERERLEIIRRQEEYEEAERRRYEEENRRREEELAIAIAEAQRIAFEEAQKQAEYEQRVKFMNIMRSEAAQLESSQLISRAFVFSYYDLLRLIGNDQAKTKQQLILEVQEGTRQSAAPMNQGSKSKRLV